MDYRTYSEFFSDLSEKLSSWDVVLGTSAESVDRETCFITHRNSVTEWSDDKPYISSSTYDLVFLTKRAAFTKREVIEWLSGGVNYQTYDEETGYHIFTGSVTLYGSNSLPEE